MIMENHTSHEDRGPQLTAVLITFLTLAWIFVSLRCCVKAFITKSWAADDYLLIVALTFFSTYCSCSLSGVKYGTGQHIWNIPPGNIPKGLYYWWLCEMFYTLATVFIRLSIAVFLLRIAIKPLHRWLIFATLGVIVVFSITYFFIVLFQCSPVSFFWLQYAGEKGKCIPANIVPQTSQAHSVISFTADWVLGLLPIALIWHLQMNIRTKVSVAGVLSLGLLAGVATLIRVPFITVLSLTDDFLYATTDVAIWSTIEPGLGLIAAGAVTLRPLFRTFYALTTRARSACYTTSRHRSRTKAEVGRPIETEEGMTRLKSSNAVSTIYSAESIEDGKWGEIQVERTLDVESKYGDGNSVISSVETPITPWPRSRDVI